MPEVKLLAESYQETGEMALERGLQALSCWYERARCSAPSIDAHPGSRRDSPGPSNT
jgi:hypothetical protein